MPTKAIDIPEHFYSVCPWVDPENTVDRIIIGDPEKPINTALVTWVSGAAQIREAINRGVDLLITHEPTFYRHRDDYKGAGDTLAEEKARVIEDASLVVIRIHDSWDRFPQIGIPHAWAGFLGLGSEPNATAADGYIHAYDIAPVSAGELASRFAARTAQIGEASIEFSGNGARIVERVGIGTGCMCNPSDYRNLGCDFAVVCDDGINYWDNIQRCLDSDMPVVCVNHGVSEEPGMITLTGYLNTVFSDVTFTHLPHPCMYQSVTAA